MTYPIVSLAFLAAALVVAAIAILARHPRDRMATVRRWIVPMAIACVVVLALTAVFDNIMIQTALMTYQRSRISGVLIGAAPLEDFAYPIAGVIMLPSVWSLMRGRHER